MLPSITSVAKMALQLAGALSAPAWSVNVLMFDGVLMNTGGVVSAQMPAMLLVPATQATSTWRVCWWRHTKVMDAGVNWDKHVRSRS